MKKYLIATLTSAGLAIASFMPAFAAASYTLDGTATETGGVLEISSTGVVTAGSADFSTADGQTFADLTALSSDYNVTDDDCGGGSPRFGIGLSNDADPDTDGYVPVYFGPTPSFSGCASGWQTTGNFIGSTDARFDLTQFGGPFYGTYADALALVGSAEITDLLLVVDGGWSQSDQEQTVQFDNVKINTTTYTFPPDTDEDEITDDIDNCPLVSNPDQTDTDDDGIGDACDTSTKPTTKDQCKNGGYLLFNDPAFKNQGQCVAFVASKGKSKGNN
jgi:hypothetical protein